MTKLSIWLFEISQILPKFIQNIIGQKIGNKNSVLIHNGVVADSGPNKI